MLQEDLSQKIVEYGRRHKLTEGESTTPEDVITALEKIGALRRAMAIRILSIRNGTPSLHSELGINDQQALIDETAATNAKRIANYMLREDKKDEGMETITAILKDLANDEEPYSPEEVFNDEARYLPADERATVFDMPAETLILEIENVEGLRYRAEEFDMVDLLNEGLSGEAFYDEEILERAKSKAERDLTKRLAPGIGTSVSQSILGKVVDSLEAPTELLELFKGLRMQEVHDHDFMLSADDPKMSELKTSLGLSPEDNLGEVFAALAKKIKQEYYEKITKELGISEGTNEMDRQKIVNRYLNRKLATAFGLDEDTDWIGINTFLEEKGII